MSRSRGSIAFAAAALSWAAPSPARVAPLHDPVLVRIGHVCHWENGCIGQQLTAMAAALKYVERKSPPSARVHACNRNASRGGQRVDWIGFNNCIRNRRMGH